MLEINRNSYCDLKKNVFIISSLFYRSVDLRNEYVVLLTILVMRFQPVSYYMKGWRLILLKSRYKQVRNRRKSDISTLARRWCLLNSLSGGRYTDSSWFNLLAGLYCYIHACESSLTNPLSGLIYVMLFKLYTGVPFMKKTTLFVWLICRQKCPCFKCSSIQFVKFSICYSVCRLPR